MGWERSGEDTPKPQQHMEGVLYDVSCPRAAERRAGQGSLTWRFSPQHHPLPGVRNIPDDGAEGPGEAGGLASHLHHFHPQWHHRQLGQCHLPAIQGGGEGWGGSAHITPNPNTSPGTKGTPLPVPVAVEVWGGLQAAAQSSLSHGRGTGGCLCPTCGVSTCRVGHASPRVSVRAGSSGRQMANLLAAKPCQALNEITSSALIPAGVRQDRAGGAVGMLPGC